MENDVTETLELQGMLCTKWYCILPVTGLYSIPSYSEMSRLLKHSKEDKAQKSVASLLCFMDIYV